MINNEFVKIYYSRDDNVVYLGWKQFCSGTLYQTALKAVLKLFLDNSGETLIIDERAGFINGDEENFFITESFIPDLMHTSCKEIKFLYDEKDELLEEIKMYERIFSEYFDVLIEG